MGDPRLSFLFKIDTIEAKDDSPPEFFTTGSYKPPIEKDHYKRLDTTDWLRWTPQGVVLGAMNPLGPVRPDVYSTSLFYDDHSTQKPFLFHPADCQAINISDVEREMTELWGWQQLCFTKKDAHHSVLDLGGEYHTLCGQSTSYIPHFLPECYKSVENGATCGLSGTMSLMIALAAFSCKKENMIAAIANRLNFRERKWENGCIEDWGDGRKMHLYTSQIRATLTIDRHPWSRSRCSHQRRWHLHGSETLGKWGLWSYAAVEIRPKSLYFRRRTVQWSDSPSESPLQSTPALPKDHTPFPSYLPDRVSYLRRLLSALPLLKDQENDGSDWIAIFLFAIVAR
jgi:hypothetical protein